MNLSHSRTKNPMFYTLKRINSSRGTSSQITKYYSKLPLQLQYKSLWYSKKWNAGRGADGWKVLRTRGARSSKLRLQSINYSFRLRNIFFIGSFIFNHHVHRLVSVIFLSSGAVSHLLTTSQHKLFTLNQLFSSFSKTERCLKGYSIPSLIRCIGLIMYLPKNKAISSLELLPCKGIQYVRSTGVFGIVLKMDLRIHTALVKLPSGVRKIFSTHSLGAVGSIALPANRDFKNNYGGFRKNKGYKSIVRGVAMNPVDHPHGGRAKAIKYQRTPWGKTTKFK